MFLVMRGFPGLGCGQPIMWEWLCDKRGRRKGKEGFEVERQRRTKKFEMRLSAAGKIKTKAGSCCYIRCKAALTLGAVFFGGSSGCSSKCLCVP